MNSTSTTLRRLLVRARDAFEMRCTGQTNRKYVDDFNTMIRKEIIASFDLFLLMSSRRCCSSFLNQHS